MSQAGVYATGTGPTPGSVLTLTGNDAVAVGPTLGNINVVGAGVVDVTGDAATSTLTISLTSSGGTDQFDTDAGNAVPSGGVINILGGTNIYTVGTGDTVYVYLDDTVSISGSFTAGTTNGFITAQTGNITAVVGNLVAEAGNLELPTTLSTGTEGVITINGSAFIQNFGGNIIIGKDAGNFTLTPTSAVANVIIGEGAFGDITIGNNNVVVGQDSLLTGTAATRNTVLGSNCGGGITTGSGNVILGAGSAANFLGTNSDNIIIGNPGNSGDHNTIRIGTQGNGSQQQDTCYIAGIVGNTISPIDEELVTIDSITGQLGSTSIGAFADSFVADTGTATPNSGVISIVGGSNINTSATTNVVTINLNNDVTISGTYTTTAGNIILPATTSSTQGAIYANTNTLLHYYGVSNIFGGINAGNFTITGGYNAILARNGLSNATSAHHNSAVGDLSLSEVTSGAYNCAFGTVSLTDITDGSYNCAFGALSATSLTSGSFNCIIGYNSGSSYTSTESSNILIGTSNAGVTGDFNVIRIGVQGTSFGEQDTCYIAGIVGNTVSNQQLVTIDSTTGQLGTTSATSGGVIWQTITTNTTLVPGNGYFVNGSSQLTLTLPTSANIGDTFWVSTLHTGNGWLIGQNAGQSIVNAQGSQMSTVGAGGNIHTTTKWGQVELVCNTTNSQFVAFLGGTSTQFI